MSNNNYLYMRDYVFLFENIRGDLLDGSGRDAAYLHDALKDPAGCNVIGMCRHHRQ